MELKGKQFEQLRIALQRAYPSKTELRRLLREELDVRLAETVGDGALTDVVEELLTWAEAQGRLVELVSAAIRRNPGNLRLRQFVESFGVVSGNESLVTEYSSSPAFEWRGPSLEQELQAFWRKKPELWDVAFLSQGIKQATSVCRIDVEEMGAIGTGFLVSRDQILTNFHVYEAAPDTSQWRLRFGRFTLFDGGETTGQTFRLAKAAVLRSSPTDRLDYVLLQVEKAIATAEGLRPVRYQPSSPAVKTSIHVLQHPHGKAMKITFGTNGITGVYEQKGLIQYISQTFVGSSGSPCFNDGWQLIALHHAEQATSFGVVCEGILFSAIHTEIVSMLT